LNSTAARKQDLRRQLRAPRAALPHPLRSKAARVAARRLLRTRWITRASCVAAYLATGSELDPQPFIDALAGRGCTVLVPRVDPRKKGRMRFVPWTRTATRVQNRYGIAEPRAPRPARVPRIDVAILPLVGFDAAGHRLGSGAGYYDRWIAGLRGRRPRLIGLAYALQEVDAVPADPWDVKMDAICTESRFRYLRGR
jgi:5-formyltetrahydrofolate cyclo-ligase